MSLKNIIIVKDGVDYECDTIKELLEFIFSDDYFSLSEEEKTKRRNLNAYKECLIKNIPILEKKEELKNKNISEMFISVDEITYIISLLKFTNTIILEKTEANIFGKYMDKQRISKNYIVLNKFVDEILENYISNLYL